MLNDYIAHAMRCPRCTAAARLPGAKRCRPGAGLWRDYLAALPPPVQYDPLHARGASVFEGWKMETGRSNLLS